MRIAVFIIGFVILSLLGVTMIAAFFISATPICIFVVGCEYLNRRRKHRFIASRDIGLPLDPPADARLVCIGDPRTWSDLTNFENEAFEPIIVRGGFGVWPATGRFATSIATLAGFFVFIALFITTVKRAPSMAGGLIIVSISISVAAAQATRAFLWPIYLRLVPGRLDVMHFSAFGRKVRKLERVPLREAKILVNLIDRYAIIDADKRHELSLLLMPEYKAFAHTLFLAAISTYTPPPLPDDDLLG